MGEHADKCPHLEGLKTFGRDEFRCPACGEALDLPGVERWVWKAEEERDEVYSKVDGDVFAEIARGESQREVYRRRKVLYELQSAPRVLAARPEMVLVVYDLAEDAYECRIFYKEPRPAWGVERFVVRALLESILELRSHDDPVVRLVAEKVGEFHAARGALDDGAPPSRRVFYANEF